MWHDEKLQIMLMCPPKLSVQIELVSSPSVKVFYVYVLGTGSFKYQRSESGPLTAGDRGETGEELSTVSALSTDKSRAMFTSLI